MGGTVERHVQVTGKIPAEGEVTIPQELLTEGDRQFGILHILHVTLLQFIVVTGDIRIKGYVLWQPVQSEPLEDVQPLALLISKQFLKRLEGFVHRCITVVHRPTPVILILEDRCLS